MTSLDQLISRYHVPKNSDTIESNRLLLLDQIKTKQNRVSKYNNKTMSKYNHKLSKSLPFYRRREQKKYMVDVRKRGSQKESQTEKKDEKSVYLPNEWLFISLNRLAL